MLRHLILIRHSLPEVVEGVSPADWRLGLEGKRRVAKLTDLIRPLAPRAVVASREPKAEVTGRLLAEALRAPFGTGDGLQELARGAVGLLPTEEYQARVARCFAEPEVAAFEGGETAYDAERRFAAALRQAFIRYPTGDLAVVTHGLVMSLFLSRFTGGDPYALWQKLDLPAFSVQAFPPGKVVVLAESVLVGEDASDED